ncbi:tRNA methyltransferase 10 -like protein B [Triplophysa tibetana]|uniref:tRNA (guanine(9)-N(1))-methyltransferase n=1 Tax=Triplophysa tibetana TaxID=1572043 RepID=A0A5A9PM84_9TELE|nr:tRNA methyltransferase 10 -like protein B [Triplophysa tibetana]
MEEETLTLQEQCCSDEGLSQTHESVIPDLNDFLRIDVELEPVGNDREENACSKNVMRKQRNWERRVEAKKSKRKEEKQRKKPNSRNKDINGTQLSKRVIKVITKERLEDARGAGLVLCVDLSMTDHMSHKKISYKRAKELGVRTLRLPIDEYMVKKSNPKNFYSKILAINQVFEILLAFCDTKDWTTALASGIPPGKGYVVTSLISSEVGQ